jgi:hypothetical protein
MGFTPHPDSTTWPGTHALATIYARAIERFEEVRKGGSSITAPDARKESDESGEIIIPNRT